MNYLIRLKVSTYLHLTQIVWDSRPGYALRPEASQAGKMFPGRVSSLSEMMLCADIWK